MTSDYICFSDPGALDVALVLDSSDDVPVANWNRIIEFTKEFVGRFPNVSPAADGTRFSLISYSRDPAVYFNFRTLQGSDLNPSGVKQLIERTPRRPGSDRNINAALKLAETKLFTNQGGARQGAKRVNTNFEITADLH